MNNKVVRFPGTKVGKSEVLCEEISVEVANLLRDKYGFDVSSTKFLHNMAWVIKFLDVLICDELNVDNELSDYIRTMES